MKTSKTSKYVNFQVAAYIKQDDNIILKELIEGKSYREMLKVCTSLKLKYMIEYGEWSVVGLRCISFDGTFNNRYVHFLNGATKDEIQGPCIFFEEKDTSINTLMEKVIEDNNVMVKLSKDNEVISKDNGIFDYHVENVVSKKGLEAITRIDDDSTKNTIEGKLLKDLENRHISEIDAEDIIKVIYKYIGLLQDKCIYAEDMSVLSEKYVNNYMKHLEFMNHYELETVEDEDKFKISLADKLIKSSRDRRYYKDMKKTCEKAIFNICKLNCFDTNDAKQLVLEKKKENVKIYKNPNVKIYRFSYSNDLERDLLRKNLNENFSKVIDVKYGVFECYNKCYTLHKDIGVTLDDSSSKDDIVLNCKNLDCVDEEPVRVEETKSIEQPIKKNYVIRLGQRIVKDIGSTVTIKNVSKKAIKALCANLESKYADVDIQENEGMLTFKNRLVK